MPLASRMTIVISEGQFPQVFRLGDSVLKQSSLLPNEMIYNYDRSQQDYATMSGATSLNDESSLSVVMPIYNEVATLEQIVIKVLAQPLVAELVAVDDCSDDGSWELLEKLQAKYSRLVAIRHQMNRGKGAALATGFSAVTAPFVVVQDADLEYDPAEYRKLLRPLLDGRASVVYGSRFGGTEEHRVLYFWHAVGNRILTLLSNMATNLNLTDMETGYKAFEGSWSASAINLRAG
jgi:glycosyltransferase involved in cell wall biosynthesis